MDNNGGEDCHRVSIALPIDSPSGIGETTNGIPLATLGANGRRESGAGAHHFLTRDVSSSSGTRSPAVIDEEIVFQNEMSLNRADGGQLQYKFSRFRVESVGQTAPGSGAQSPTPNQMYGSLDAPSWQGIIGTALRPDMYRPSFKTGPDTSKPSLRYEWQHPGWGSVTHVDLSGEPPVPKRPKASLGQWRATSIAGNDVMAGVLYTIGLTVATAGPLAPVCLVIMCAIVVPILRMIAELALAMPFNGGLYSFFLNTSSKLLATVVACLSLLCYICTSVVSGASAAAYLGGEVSSINQFWLTIGIFCFFAALCLFGVKESSYVAMSIFFLHIVTLAILFVAALVFVIRDGGSILKDNYASAGFHSPNAAYQLFFGFCVAMLAGTGFETTANYVEEAGPGVFTKILRNMWALVTLFDPTLCLLALGCLPMADIVAHQDATLSIMAEACAGKWLRWLVVVDAFIVLCGGVLTAVVGVTGLIERMTFDRCLPQFLAQRNRFFHSNHWIILSFLVLSCGLFAILDGDVTSLSGVFTLAFVCVMAAFAVASIYARYKRPRLPRSIVPSGFSLFIGLAGALSALGGLIYLNPSYLGTFFLFYLIPLAAVALTLNKVRIYKVLMHILHRSKRFHDKGDVFVRKIKQAKQHSVGFLTSTDEIHVLNRAILYTTANEFCNRVKLIHVYKHPEDAPRFLTENHYILDHVYPKVQIDLILARGEFSPDAIEQLSHKLGIPVSFFFMRSPGPSFPYAYGDLHGVRLILP